MAPAVVFRHMRLRFEYSVRLVLGAAETLADTVCPAVSLHVCVNYGNSGCTVGSVLRGITAWVDPLTSGVFFGHTV